MSLLIRMSYGLVKKYPLERVRQILLEVNRDRLGSRHSENEVDEILSKTIRTLEERDEQKRNK